MTERRRRELKSRREKKGQLSKGTGRKFHRGRKKPNKFMVWYRGLSKAKRIWFKVGAISLAVLLLVAGIVAAWAIPKVVRYNKRIVKIDGKDIFVDKEVEKAVGSGYTNFVLFAGDSRTGQLEKGVRSDGIIIASLNNQTKEIKLVSVYRDTLLDIGDGNFQKCNAAYSYGGPAQAINMLNRNLDLNIKKFVTVDFAAVSEIIDLLGGIRVDVSEAERIATNRYIAETARVAGKKANFLTKSGVQTLDGVQATTYARIRKGVGDDYQRTERQRIIIEKTMEKAKKADFITLDKIIDKAIDMVYTNFELDEALKYAKDIAQYKIGETTGFPIDKTSKTLSMKGSCVIPVTLEDNVAQLHEFLFDQTDYQPTQNVIAISNKIVSMVGAQTADPHTGYNPEDYEIPDENDEKDEKPDKDDKKHTHEWTTEFWDYDASGHWHACKGEGCIEKSDFAAHDFANATATCAGTKCNVCSFMDTSKKAEGHGETVTDENGNVVCIVCGEIVGTSSTPKPEPEPEPEPVECAHEYDKTCTGGTCKKCGVVDASQKDPTKHTGGESTDADGNTICNGCGAILVKHTENTDDDGNDNQA